MVQLPKKVSGSSTCYQSQKVSIFFPHWSYLSLLQCLMFVHWKFLKLLRVAPSLLILLTNLEGSYLMLAIFPFILEYGLTQLNECDKCRNHLQATRGLGYSHSFLPHWVTAYLHLTFLIERILPSSHLR